MQRNFLFTQTKKSEYPVPSREAFEDHYDEHFDQLRSAAKYNKLGVIEKFKSTLLKSQFLKLLHDKNQNYSDCAIIHYAAKYNRAEVIQSLVGHLRPFERLEVFLLSYITKCTTLHFTATINIPDDSSCSYEAAAKIKELLYINDDHSLWLKLLAKQQECLDTPVHYAARQKSPNLLRLFSSGLNSKEWINILSILNENNHTAMHVYFINMRKTIDGSQKDFIEAFRSNMQDDEWVEFVVSSKILKALNPNDSLEFYCIQLISCNLSQELIDELSLNWRTQSINTAEKKLKPF